MTSLKPGVDPFKNLSRCRYSGSPESPQSIVEMADAVGSTSQLIKAAKTLPHRQLIVATDRGIFYKMQQAVPEKSCLKRPRLARGDLP